MKFTKNTLLKISFLSGLIPLVGGVGIFLTWFFARYFYAIDLHNLERVGFSWMIICFFVALFGLFLLLVHVIIKRKNLNINMLYTLIMILINIPTVIGVVYLQEIADQNIYVKLTNNTNLDNVRFTFVSNQNKEGGQAFDSKKVLPIKQLDNGESTVFCLSPKDEIFYEFRNPAKELKLELKTDKAIKMGHFDSNQGLKSIDCNHFSIDANYKISIK